MRFQDLTAPLSDEFLLRYQNELQDFWLNTEEKLEAVKSAFFHQTLTHLCQQILYELPTTAGQPPAEAARTEELQSRYQLLGEFLAEPAPQEDPARSARPRQEAIARQWRSQIAALMDTNQPEAWKQNPDLEAVLQLWQDQLETEMLEKLQQIPFYWMLEAYTEAATDLELEQRRQASLLKRRLTELRIQTARQLHHKARLLLTREKYDLPEADLLQTGLKQLRAEVGELDFSIYLQSPIFTALCSSQLCAQIRALFLEQQPPKA